MKDRALICGISGQDGAYLARLLLSKNYEVWGTSRDAEAINKKNLEALGIFEKVRLVSMIPDNLQSVLGVFSEIRPSEVYNLAAQSSVQLSFEKPIKAMESIASGTFNQLEAVRQIDKTIRYFNAGSSECFGDTQERGASETTIFKPLNPYAVAKAAASWQVSVYRSSYEIFSCTGILFNHESPLRSDRFVTRKVVEAARRISQGSKEKLVLGNLDIRRDWGWAPEYVEAMWRMLNRASPEDFVIATGVTQSLKEFVETVFKEAGLDWRQHVVSDAALHRQSDILVSKGNPCKAEIQLMWKAQTIGPEVGRLMFHQSHLAT